MTVEANRKPPDLEAIGAGSVQDVELIRAVAHGDRRAFEAIYYRHRPRTKKKVMPAAPTACGSRGGGERCSCS